ncbi:MAG: winged helix-turn-helix transcriptional regulator [Candidatus Aenigmarchaeota archaeon]|nr:winged helix-turn-helix transcriptional regulator [Candidatus Aenigmarchaeota archaeon]
MITFACKKIKQEEFIRCSFNLNKTEYNILMFLLKKNQKCSVIQMAEAMNLERTTVQKAIKSLLSKKLVRKWKRNLAKGGCLYLYIVIDKEDIKKNMRDIIYRWYQEIEKQIKNL